MRAISRDVEYTHHQSHLLVEHLLNPAKNQAITNKTSKIITEWRRRSSHSHRDAESTSPTMNYPRPLEQVSFSLARRLGSSLCQVTYFGFSASIPFRFGAVVWQAANKRFNCECVGSFGRVMLARNRRSGEFFAMKRLKKSDIIKLRQVDHVISENTILADIEHPFLVSYRNLFDPFSIRLFHLVLNLLQMASKAILKARPIQVQNEL